MDDALSLEDLKEFYDNTNSTMTKVSAKKLKDNNTIKCNASNPYDRVVQIPRVHWFTFKKFFGINGVGSVGGGAANVNGEKKQVIKIDSIVDLQKIFSVQSIMRVHSSGDLTLITPWMKLTSDMSVKFLNGCK